MSEEDRARWDARYAAGNHGREQPSPFLEALIDRLPPRGRALDVAGGAGRNALLLARHGLDVTVVDVSEVGLAIARRRAEEAGLAIRTERRDLAADGLPAGPWDVIVSILYLERRLFPAYRAALAPGGLLCFLQPTVDNLLRHARPPRPFLLEPGEIAKLARELDVIELTEGWTEDGHHEARLFARKPLERPGGDAGVTRQ
jgi:tellurite methyltransferase